MASRPLHVSLCLRAEHPCSRADVVLNLEALQLQATGALFAQRGRILAEPTPWNRSKLERIHKHGYRVISSPFLPPLSINLAEAPSAPRSLQRGMLFRIANDAAGSHCFWRQNSFQL